MVAGLLIGAGVGAGLIRSQTIEKSVPSVAPVGLVVRELTGLATTDDPVVDKAVAFIQANARRDVRVADVVDQVNVRRRVLERRFRAALHGSPHEQIIHTKVEQVKQLLLTTDMGTEAIAEASGFNPRAPLSGVFPKATGLTMMQFRGRGKPVSRGSMMIAPAVLRSGLSVLVRLTLGSPPANRWPWRIWFSIQSA